MKSVHLLFKALFVAFSLVVIGGCERQNGTATFYFDQNGANATVNVGGQHANITQPITRAMHLYVALQPLVVQILFYPQARTIIALRQTRLVGQALLQSMATNAPKCYLHKPPAQRYSGLNLIVSAQLR